MQHGLARTPPVGNSKSMPDDSTNSVLFDGIDPPHPSPTRLKEFLSCPRIPHLRRFNTEGFSRVGNAAGMPVLTALLQNRALQGSFHSVSTVRLRRRLIALFYGFSTSIGRHPVGGSQNEYRPIGLAQRRLLKLSS